MHHGDLRPSRASVRQAGLSPQVRSRTYSWDDPSVSAAAARAQDGMSFLEGMVRGSLPPPPVALTLDFLPVSVQPGCVVFEF
ncbi:MAG TPA: hypothetical protein VEL03_12540, partial [Streptosporangiaceae bacterium]|nr:hypothetical protein [Streptosporangiaceae bacterium]